MPNSYLSPGVSVQELRSGLPQIRGVPTSIGGFVGSAKRGPVAYPVLVSSFAQFNRAFGGYTSSSYLAESVKGFFDNGGAQAYIIRVLGSSGGSNAKASVTLADAALTSIMTFTSVGEGSANNATSILSASNNTTLGTGLTTQISAGSTQSANFSAGIISRLTVGDTVSLTDGANTIRFVIANIQNNMVTFAAATTAGGTLSTATTVVTIETFTLTVFYNGTIVEGPFFNLRLSPLSAKNYFVTRIGGVLGGTLGANSVNPVEYVVNVVDLAAAVPNEDLRPVNVVTTGTGDPLVGGAEAATFADADYIGQNATLPFTGIYAATILQDLRMLAIPGVTGITTGAVSKALVQFCESQGSLVALITAPLNTSPTNCATYKQNNIGTSSYQCFYYPWVQILSPLFGVPTMSPPEGYVMGMFARTDQNQTTAKAPAGEATGQLVDTIGIERILSSSDKNLLYPLNINPIENIPDVGQCVMGSRTGDFPGGDFQQVHVRRTFIYFEQSLLLGTRFVLFEPNTASTRAKLKRVTDSFMELSWRSGLLDGDTLAKAFTTICDDSNNPPVIVAAQQMVESIFVNIPQTVENLVITIQQNSAATAPSSV
jgi:phage tail sheath protein FI